MIDPTEAGPEPCRLAPLPDGRNPIHAFLDETRLPWREPRAEVEKRFGIVADPLYRWDVVSFDTVTPIVPGLLHPLMAQTFQNFAPHLPITNFSGVAWFEADARANIGRVAGSLAEHFGPAPVGKESAYGKPAPPRSS